MENFILENFLKFFGKFCTRKFSEIFRKFCNQVARVESSENSEGGCIPVWDMKRPRAGKEKRDGKRPALRFS